MQLEPEEPHAGHTLLCGSPLAHLRACAVSLRSLGASFVMIWLFPREGVSRPMGGRV